MLRFGVHVPARVPKRALSYVCAGLLSSRGLHETGLRVSKASPDGNATSPSRDGIKELQSRATGESKNRPVSTPFTFSLDYTLAKFVKDVK